MDIFNRKRIQDLERRSDLLHDLIVAYLELDNAIIVAGDNVHVIDVLIEGGRKIVVLPGVRNVTIRNAIIKAKVTP